MGGEAQQQPLMYPQQDYQQQVGRRGSGRGRGGRTPGRGRGRGRGGGGGSRSRGAAAYGDGSSDFSLDGSEADEEAMTEDEDDEWTGLKAKSVSKRGRARWGHFYEGKVYRPCHGRGMDFEHPLHA